MHSQWESVWKGICRMAQGACTQIKKWGRANHFFFMYMTKENGSTASRSKQGWFESLAQFIAAWFKSQSTNASLIDTKYSESGVLILSQADKEKIRASMRQNPNVLQKFHSFLAYQVEFGYDIALVPGTNVSRSLGFESFVGLFGVWDRRTDGWQMLSGKVQELSRMLVLSSTFPIDMLGVWGWLILFWCVFVQIGMPL